MATDVVCDAILFADRVITENNGKKGLIGVFTNMNFAAFPVTAPTFFIFVALRNLDVGRHDFGLTLTSDKNQVMFSAPGEIEVKNIRAGIELVVPILGMAFYRPGQYDLSVHVDGTFIAGKPLSVFQVGSKEEK